MARTFGLFAVFIVMVNSVIGSPLVFTKTREVNTNEIIELGSFDATKYKQIRIGIKCISDDGETQRLIGDLIQKRAERLATRERLTNEGIRPKHPDMIRVDIELDRLNDQIDSIKKARSALTINILGVEGTDEIPIAIFNERKDNYSIVLDTPPSRISIRVIGQGKYTLFVWGTV